MNMRRRKNSIFVEATELVTHFDEIAKWIPKKRVVLERRHKPLAVLVDPKKFEEMLEDYSDLILALEAREREMQSTEKDYIDFEVFKKKLEIKGGVQSKEA